MILEYECLSLLLADLSQIWSFMWQPLSCQIIHTSSEHMQPGENPLNETVTLVIYSELFTL